MTQEKKAAAHVYTVELSFYGDQLEPSEISARLSLQPSGSLSQSQIQSSVRKRRPRPYWGYDGRGMEGYQLEWTSLEDGLEFLLKILAPKRAEIVILARQFDSAWWCGHFQASFDGGPNFSPKILADIASYGVPLFIDNYFDFEFS